MRKTEPSLLVPFVAIVILSLCCQSPISAARLIKIPLAREKTLGTGQYGQPVINYYAAVKIGTPPITLKLQFDVNFGDTFVPHYEWNPFYNNLHYRKGFKCKSSSSCKKTNHVFEIEYQQCRLKGKPYEDIVVFDNAYPANSQNVTNSHVSFRQNFLAISDASTPRFKELPIDGFIGLGPQQTSESSVNNVIVSLLKAELIDRLQFSFWFNPALDSSHGGELILGGVDENRYQGQIYWHNLISSFDNHWTVRLQHVFVGNQVVACDGRCEANLSTGLSDIYGPIDDVRKIYNLLNVISDSTASTPGLVDCHRIPSLPIITFTIDGVPYSLLPTNYIRTTNDGLFKKDTCYVAILPGDGNKKQWTMGTNFLGAYYSIFDMTYKQVGIASLR